MGHTKDEVIIQEQAKRLTGSYNYMGWLIGEYEQMYYDLWVELSIAVKIWHKHQEEFVRYKIEQVVKFKEDLETAVKLLKGVDDALKKSSSM